MLACVCISHECVLYTTILTAAAAAAAAERHGATTTCLWVRAALRYRLPPAAASIASVTARPFTCVDVPRPNVRCSVCRRRRRRRRRLRFRRRPSGSRRSKKSTPVIRHALFFYFFLLFYLFFFPRTVFSNGYVTRAEQRTCTSSVVPCGGRGRGDGTGCADETDGQTELARNGTAGRGGAWCG